MSDEWCAHGPSLNCKDCEIERLMGILTKIEKGTRAGSAQRAAWVNEIARAALKVIAPTEQGEPTQCHCGRTLDTVGRCEYHGLPEQGER